VGDQGRIGGARRVCIERAKPDSHSRVSIKVSKRLNPEAIDAAPQFGAWDPVIYVTDPAY
jgi:hypothetical protein